MNYGTGAIKSPLDIRTFSYKPTKASFSGGEKWKPEDIEHQHRVGICTSISLTMRARKHYGIKFSAEFQYLMQKKLYDSQTAHGWNEGSSIFHALKVGKNVGFLPESEWKFTTEEDRLLPYHVYIEKLKAIPDSEIEKLKVIASKYKLKAYANVPVDRESMANAISSSGALLTRFDIGSYWWIEPIEPLRPNANPISGHAINETNYTGRSFRLANSWGPEWADGGTAYYVLDGNISYRPTEAWAVWFEELPKEIEEQVVSRSTIIGQIMDLLQKVIVLIAKLR